MNVAAKDVEFLIVVQKLIQSVIQPLSRHFQKVGFGCGSSRSSSRGGRKEGGGGGRKRVERRYSSSGDAPLHSSKSKKLE